MSVGDGTVTDFDLCRHCHQPIYYDGARTVWLHSGGASTECIPTSRFDYNKRTYAAPVDTETTETTR